MVGRHPVLPGGAADRALDRRLAAPLPGVRSTQELFANSPVAFLTVLLVGVVNGAFGTLAAVWGTRIGLSTP